MLPPKIQPTLIFPEDNRGVGELMPLLRRLCNIYEEVIRMPSDTEHWKRVLKSQAYILLLGELLSQVRAATTQTLDQFSLLYLLPSFFVIFLIISFSWCFWHNFISAMALSVPTSPWALLAHCYSFDASFVSLWFNTFFLFVLNVFRLWKQSMWLTT